MAEQRPYRMPGTADAWLARTKRLAISSLVAAFIAINWVTTQHAAHVLRDAPWLGQPPFHLPKIGAVYAPWASIAWWIRWHGAPALAPLWALCAREALYPMAIVGAIAAGAIGMARQGWLANPSDLHGSARWATTRDLKAARLIERRGGYVRKIGARMHLLLPMVERAGVYLGIWRRTLIRDCGPAHVLVFAPTRSGKGVGIVIPTLLTWPHSVLVHDLKGENWALTAGTRKRMGQACLRFAPASADGDGARFNPLSEIRLRTPNEVRDVRNVVQMIIDPDGKGLPDHWSREGSAFLTGMILDQLYAGRDRTLSGLEARLCDPDHAIDATIQQIMRGEHDPAGTMGWTDARGIPTRTHPIIARAMRSMLDKSPNERSGVISEVKGFLELYRDPVIATNTKASDFRITDLMKSRAAGIALRRGYAGPQGQSQAAHPADAESDSASPDRTSRVSKWARGDRLPASTAAHDRRVPKSRAARHVRRLAVVDRWDGIKACLIAQDLSQIHAAYGHDEAITPNCHTRVAFTPNRIETARLLSQMTGETTLRHAHRTISNSGASISEPEVGRPLFTPDEAMRLGANETLIFASGRPASRAGKLRYYSHPNFRRLAEIPPPARCDRIEVDLTETVLDMSARAEDARETIAEPPPAPALPSQPAKPKTRKSETGEQLSFLKFAVEDGNHATDAAKEQRPKERLL